MFVRHKLCITLLEIQYSIVIFKSYIIYLYIFFFLHTIYGAVDIYYSLK